jgi:hypothetical protein
MDADAAARHSSGLLAILSVARRLMNGASQAPLTNREDETREKQFSNAHISYEQAGLVEWGVLVTRSKLDYFSPPQTAFETAFDSLYWMRHPHPLISIELLSLMLLCRMRATSHEQLLDTISL